MNPSYCLTAFLQAASFVAVLILFVKRKSHKRKSNLRKAKVSGIGVLLAKVEGIV